MKLVIEKEYPVYTIKTINNDGVEQKRYSYDVTMKKYFSLDGKSRGINTYGAEMDSLTEHLLTALRIIREINRSPYCGDVTGDLEKWIMADPTLINRIQSSLGNNMVIRFAKEVGAPNKRKIKIARDLLVPCKSSASGDFLNRLRLCPIICNSSKEFSSEFVNFLLNTSYTEIIQYNIELAEYLFKVYCRLGLLEIDNIITKGTLASVARGYSSLLAKASIYLEDEELAEIIKATLNFKDEPLKNLSLLEAAITVAKSKKEEHQLENNIKRFIYGNGLDKKSDAFSFEFLSDDKMYSSAGEQWHNCLGQWGITKAHTEKHVVAIVTPKDEKPFVSGMYFDRHGKFDRFSYNVYYSNKDIPAALRKRYVEYLLADWEI